MAALTSEKRPWTGCVTCVNRGDCDWCLFVVDRKETPLGADHVWSRHRELDGEGNLLHPGLLDKFTAPPGDTCPFGVTFEQAQIIRSARLVADVRRRVISAEQALLVAEAMGLTVDEEL